MATVFFMRFNEKQGALIADESTWHLSFKYGYRRSNYGDSILNLLDEKTMKKHNMVAVYAGIGFPSFHFEVARKSRKLLNKPDARLENLASVSREVFKNYQEVHERMIDDKLRFFFGFGRDEFNEASFDFDGKTYEIKQDAVIGDARKIIKFQDKSDAMIRIFQNRGLVMGYDEKFGLDAFTLDNDSCSVDFAYEFGALGDGKEIGTRVFGELVSRMSLDERRKGFDMLEGLYILLRCAVEAYDSQVKLGGYFQIFLIDGKKEYLGDFTKEITRHNSHLTAEALRVRRWGYIDKETAKGFIRRLLIDGEDYERVEEELLRKTGDEGLIKKYLMGYKPKLAPITATL